jgi:hypothetical protein
MRTTIMLLAALLLGGCIRVKDARVAGQNESVSIRYDATNGKTHYLAKGPNGELTWVPVLAPK